MKFRPCIDLHKGKVKQIVGSSLSDSASHTLQTNFESDRSPSEFALMYAKDSLQGGHVIMLGPGNESAAKKAVGAFPGGLHIGGGITPINAGEYLDAGASHVIVTSYVFAGGVLKEQHLTEMVNAVGKERLVLDLSCKRVDGGYRIATDRWQNISSLELSGSLLERLSRSCDEFLVHAADVEGKRGGIDTTLVELLGRWSPVPITYAGGIRSIEDFEMIERLGDGKVDATVGSALDIFGGDLLYSEVVRWHKERNHQ